MHHHYNDITSRILAPPMWYDENAVPRYCDFAPDEVADIYATEVALVEIACQDCGQRFNVAFSWDRVEWVKGVPRLHEAMTLADVKRLHYGDPPNAGCCPAGPTMNCDDLRVLEFWRKDEAFTWTRIPELEVALADA